jgi:RNA polymerase sigma-70 factor (ECF subfamily)
VIEQHVSVRALVRSLGVDADWVDDLAQEVFLTAYGLWSSFEETRDFGRWVRGIAATLFRNEIREDSWRRRILHRELTDILLSRIAGSKPTQDIFRSLRPAGG